MAEICIILHSGIQHAPYEKRYSDLLTNSYDVISWDRGEGFIKDDKAEHNFVFMQKLGLHELLIKRLYAYNKYKKFIYKILADNQYKKLFILQIGIGILIERKLVDSFSNNYILDIRDYFYEKNKLISVREKCVIENSYGTVISSEGYKEYLPKFNYCLCHNNQENEYRRYRSIKNTDGPIRISFIGSMAYKDIQKKLLERLGNDKRFWFYYYGVGCDSIGVWCKKRGIKNVTVGGAFRPEELMERYMTCDMINNIYGNHTPHLDYALSNKLYVAGELRKPILVCPDTYMETVVNQYKMGISIDLNSPFLGNNIYEYYTNINYQMLEKNCINFMNHVYRDNNEFINMIKRFLKK